MKVLQVIGSLSPEWGGLSRAAARLSEAMAELGAKIEIITTAKKGEDQLQLCGVTVQTFERDKPEWWAYSSKAAQAIKESVRKVDIIHLHGLWLHPHYVASRLAQRDSKPYIISPQGMLDVWALKHKGWKKRLYGNLIEWRTLRHAAMIHAVSKSEAGDIRRLKIQTPVITLPNGVGLHEFDFLPSRANFYNRYTHLRGKTVILFFGRLHPKKGVDILIEAFIQLMKTREDTILLFVGPDEIGYQAKLMARLEAEGMVKYCVFTGMLNGEDRLAAMAVADVFVLPSYSEGLPLAAVEAMAAGLPVILTEACNISGITEIGAGHIIAPEVKPLLRALQDLIEHPEKRRAMGQRGKEMIASSFTWDKIAAKMLETYGELVISKQTSN